MKGLRIFIYVILFFYFFFAFFPKESLVLYVNENILKKEKIEIKLLIENNFINLQANDSMILYDGNKIASLKLATLSPYIFYNRANIKNVVLEGILGSFIPQNIVSLDISYSIINPTQLNFTANGDAGEAQGYFDMTSNKIVFSLIPSNLMKKSYGFVLNKASKKEDNKFFFEYTL